MMNQVSVSIIVPIYNVERYLRECLDSLERQTLKNLEIILVIDGSTDNSAIIAKDYSERNNNFILINRENGGLSAARNTGLKYASGKYVYFLDSDDYILDNTLELLFQKAEADNLDLVQFSAYTFIDTYNKLNWEHKNGYKYSREYPLIYNGTELLNILVHNGDAYPCSCLSFIRREVLQKNDLKFYEGIIHEDNLFYLQLISLCKRVAVINKPLYCYRIRNGSITQQTDYVKKVKAMYICAVMTDKFFTEHPQIRTSAITNQIEYFIYTMREHWYNMDPIMHKNREIKGYFSKIKPLTRKYKYCYSRRMFLFTESKLLDEIYRRLRNILLIL